MAENENVIIDEQTKMTSDMRYYYRNREEKIAKVKERYNNNPDVIAKRQEKEHKKAEKEAAKELKRIEKERIRQEKLALAEATKRTLKEKSVNGLDTFLTESPPAGK
jgi:hypothetical protein